MGRPASRRATRASTVLAAAVSLLALVTACGGDGGGSPEEFCPLVADRAGLAAVVDGFDPSDRDRALDQLRSARVELGRLREAAPGAIRDDLDVQIEAAQTLIEALEAVPPGDPAAAVGAVRSVQDDLDEVPVAADRLEAWAAEHC